MKRILIIDDDIQINRMLHEVLTRAGYEALHAYSGTEALLLLERVRPELCLLDLMLPGLSGEEVLPRIAGIPVIVISAKAGIDDRVNLLLGGAADYLTKPFDTRELLARIQVQLRGGSTRGLAPVYTFGSLTLDTASRSVSAAEIPVTLTKTEYAILKLLIQNPGQVVARSVILDHISEDTPDGTERSLKQHISNLRKKFLEAGARETIEAVWGIGFKLEMVNNQEA